MKWYLQNSTKMNSFSLSTVWKLACVRTKTPPSTLGSASHWTKPENASRHVVTANKYIFDPAYLFGITTPTKKKFIQPRWTDETN